MQQDLVAMKRRIAGDYREKNMNRRRRDQPSWGSLDKYLPKEEDGPRETARSAQARVPTYDMARDDTSNESVSNVRGAQFPGHIGQ